MIKYKQIDDNLYAIKASGANVFLIKDKKNILIDTGTRAKCDELIEVLSYLDVLDSLELIYLTHGHWDHCENVKYIKEKTGAKIMMFSGNEEDIANSLNSDLIAHGIFKGLINRVLRNTDTKHNNDWGFIADVVLYEDTKLEKYSNDLTAINLKGHTKNSSGLLYKDYLICGDLIMSFIPFVVHKPIFIYDFNIWNKAIIKAKTISEKWLIAHGKLGFYKIN